ncbi:MAG TPA: TerB family tellurite resistance protein [Agriterribacter sp.]|nr:TerB family tellurite resistance protein [Agriterribacter sp.]
MSIEILAGGSAQEKTAYLTAIASITTTDNVASDEELQYLLNLASHAGLSESDKVVVQQAALDTTGSGLKPALDTLKSSELRYSLVTDLIAFAESDSNLAAEEKEHIADVAQYLGISAQQLDALNAYVQHAASQPQEAFAAAAAPAAGGGLPDSLGIGNTLQNSGINLGSVAKGLLSFVGPMILSNLMSKGLNRGNTNPNAGMGGLGNLGSLLGGLTSGRGMSGMGGLLSGLLR